MEEVGNRNSLLPIEETVIFEGDQPPKLTLPATAWETQHATEGVGYAGNPKIREICVIRVIRDSDD